MRDLDIMSQWVRELRARTGLSQSQLAERVGLSTTQIRWIENDRRCPGKPVLILMRQMSDLLNMPPPPACSIAELRKHSTSA